MHKAARYLLLTAALGLAGCGADPSGPKSDDSVVAAASAPGMVSAVLGGQGRTVALAFNTSDGMSARDLLVTTNLADLPSGWSAASSGFWCPAVSTGNGCVLNLTYAPTSNSSGTLLLVFGYTNNAGDEETGTISLPYAASTHDNVVANPSPSGQLSVVSGGAQPVTVTFNTDDGNVATVFTLTSALSSLPSGWSGSASGLSCGTVSTGNTCQLNLTYAPTANGSGTLALAYSYTDNAGTAKTGSISIPYIATSNDNAVATVNPPGSVLINAGGNQMVIATFTTDDGNSASSLSIAGSVLSALPSGWSSASNSFSCAAFSTGSSCQLELTFAPSAATSGTLQLPYSYTDNAGTAKTGSVSLVYATTPGLYVAEQGVGIIKCAIGASGALSGCAPTGSGFQGPFSVAFYNNYAYVSDLSGSSSVDVCPVAQDGTLGACTVAYSIPQTGNLEVHGSYLYVPWGDPSTSVNGPTVCAIGSDGSLSNCTETGADPSETSDVAFFGQYIYVSTYAQHGAGLLLCTAGSGGSISGCNGVSTGVYQEWSTYVYQSNLYMTQQAGLTICAIGSDGSLSNCATSMPFSYGGSGWQTTPAGGFAISNGYAYISYQASNFPVGYATGVAVCTVNTDGTLSNCTDSGASFESPYAVVLH